MKIAALILGLIGGIAGLFGSIFALSVGGIGSAVSAEGANTVVGAGVAALILSLLGIVGGSLAIAKPKVAGIMMLTASIGGLVAVFAAYFIAFPLLLLGGIFALARSRPEPVRRTDVPA